MWTITESLAERARNVGKGLKNAQDDFKELYHDCCVERGGMNWLKGEYEGIFHDVQKELRNVMVDEGCISASTFYSYCAATRKCLVFDVPWSFTRKCTKIKDLARINKIMDGFDGDGDLETNLDRAYHILCKEKTDASRQAKVDNGMARSVAASPIGLPLPDADESVNSFLTKLFQNFCNYCDGSKVKDCLNDPFLQAMLVGARGGLAYHEKKSVAN